MHVIPFEGEDAGLAPLTWGQQEIWQTIQRTGRTLNIGGTVALPPGARLDEFTTALGFLVSRHQALRTRLRFEDDALPLQMISASGTVNLEIVSLFKGDGADADAAAETLRSRYEFTPFDYEREFPVRWGLVTVGDRPTHMVVQYSHLVVDGFGIEALIRDLAHLDPATGASTAPVAGVRPMDLGTRQATGAAERRHSDKSLRYWEQQLRDLPSSRFGSSDDPREPRFWELVMHSPALHLALQAVAARVGVETGHVLLAAYGVALARVTGRSPAVAQVLVSNRFRPGFADAVCHLTQPGLCVIDVGSDPDPGEFDVAVKQVWKSATSAYLHGYYDPVAHRAMLDRLAAQRGEPIDLSCYVNDRRGPAAAAPAVPPDPARIEAALQDTTMRWDRRLPAYDGTLYLQVDAGDEAVELAIWADTHRLSPASVQECARQIEAVAVAAATRR